jgi:hypothetical protein
MTLTAATYKMSVNESETITDAQTIGGGRTGSAADLGSPIRPVRALAALRNLDRS